MNEVVNFKPGDMVRANAYFKQTYPDLSSQYKGILVVSNDSTPFWVKKNNCYKVFNPEFENSVFVEGTSQYFELVKQKGT